MNCRIGCAACCIDVSISSPLPGMPDGKPAGIRCVNLNLDNGCKIHDQADYPAVCRNLTPSLEMCGISNEYAHNYLHELEIITAPEK